LAFSPKRGAFDARTRNDVVIRWTRGGGGGTHSGPDGGLKSRGQKTRDFLQVAGQCSVYGGEKGSFRKNAWV